MSFCFISLYTDDIRRKKNGKREEEIVKNDNHMGSHLGMFILHNNYRGSEKHAVKHICQE